MGSGSLSFRATQPTACLPAGCAVKRRPCFSAATAGWCTCQVGTPPHQPFVPPCQAPEPLRAEHCSRAWGQLRVYDHMCACVYPREGTWYVFGILCIFSHTHMYLCLLLCISAYMYLCNLYLCTWVVCTCFIKYM